MQVATVTPVVTSSTANLASNAATVTISGYGFNATTPSDNTVTFSGAAVGTVTAATATRLTVTFATEPTAGNLTASVASNGQSSGSAVQVASVGPVVLSNAAYHLAANATTLIINGYGFDTTPGETPSFSATERLLAALPPTARICLQSISPLPRPLGAA